MIGMSILSDEEFKRLLSLIEDWEVETSWEEIDEILYDY